MYIYTWVYTCISVINALCMYYVSIHVCMYLCICVYVCIQTDEEGFILTLPKGDSGRSRKLMGASFVWPSTDGAKTSWL